nr:hypothetical protein [Tanacetum cinerariifolium]
MGWGQGHMGRSGGKVTSGLSTLRSIDSNYKGGDAAGSGMGRMGVMLGVGEMSDPDEDPEDDDDEDPKEDLVDYPADHDDDEEEEEEPSGDDVDEEDEEQDKDDDDDEEEHPASADSIPPPPTLRVTAKISFRPQTPTLSFIKEDAKRFLAIPIPPPSPLTPLSSPLKQIPSPPLPASPPSSPYHYLLHHHPYSYYL